MLNTGKLLFVYGVNANGSKYLVQNNQNNQLHVFDMTLMSLPVFYTSYFLNRKSYFVSVTSVYNWLCGFWCCFDNGVEFEMNVNLNPERILSHTPN